jgi:tRNA threonylcarbamoyladenosine biosynthesis protein TsaB
VVAAAEPGQGWVLGIDASSETVSLALNPVGPGSAGAELAWHAGRNQTATLLAQIDHLLRLCEIDSDALGAVVVATGPGGFNALRVGMSVAKGFAFALSIPIFGVGTLDAAAQPFARWSLPVRAFVPAGRGRVVFADYAHLGGRLQQHGEMVHRAVGDLAADLRTPTVLAGELAGDDAPRLGAREHVVLPGPALRRRRAAVLIDLALPRWRAGEQDDLTTLEPIYVHHRADDVSQVATAAGARV